MARGRPGAFGGKLLTSWSVWLGLSALFLLGLIDLRRPLSLRTLDLLVLLERIDVGIAVQTDEGLVVPVVRGCESLSVDAIAAEVGRLAHEARDGRLTADELRDSTFTVTSAGKLGGVFVTPLVNHPEVAILGLHRAVERPVVRAGQVVVRRVGNVSVSFDHRVVDGARAAAFCLDVIERLQSGRPPGA